jgi:Uma2 family endonuclease
VGVAVKKLSWDDIKHLPETAGRSEIVDGDLIVSPPPFDHHQEIATALAVAIYPFVRRNRLGKFYGAPVHVVLAEHVNYEPDLCFLAAKNLDRLRSPIIVGPPDLIIEVISEDNRTHDTVVKFRDYERYAVSEYWLVDPRERHVSVFVLEEGRYAPLGVFPSGSPVQTRVLAGLQLDPAEIF